MCQNFKLKLLLCFLCVASARLHTEKESGFYTGRIEAVDLENHQYWVTFDRPGLGKHSVPDTEIKVFPHVYCTAALIDLCSVCTLHGTHTVCTL